MSKNLYAIADKYRDLFERIEELDGEITPEIDQELAITKEELEEKLYAYYSVIQGSKAQDSMIDDQISRLKQMKSSNDNLRKRLSLKVLDAANEFGYDGKSGNKKIDLDTLKVYTVNKDALEIEDEDAFSDPLFTYVTIKVPNNFDLIKSVLEKAIDKSKEIDSELHKVIQTDNLELNKEISKKRVADALKLGNTVKGARLYNKPYVIMR